MSVIQADQPRFARCALFWAVAVLWLTGCGLMPWKPKPPKATAAAPTVSVTQSGSAESPATANTASTEATLPIPAGSTVKVHAAQVEGAPAAPDPVSVELSAPSVLTVKSRAEAVAGPRAFTPPAPPTPAEVARGEGVRWFYIGGVLAGLAAIWAFSAGHPINGGACVLGAVGLPILGNFFGSEWALRLALVVGAVSAALVVAWLVLRKYHPEYIAAIKAKLPADA